MQIFATIKCLNAVEPLNEVFIIYSSASPASPDVARGAAALALTGLRLIRHSCGDERITSGSSLSTLFHLTLLFPAPGGAHSIHTPHDRRDTWQQGRDTRAGQSWARNSSSFRPRIKAWPGPFTLARPSLLTDDFTLQRS